MREGINVGGSSRSDSGWHVPISVSIACLMVRTRHTAMCSFVSLVCVHFTWACPSLARRLEQGIHAYVRFCFACLVVCIHFTWACPSLAWRLERGIHACAVLFRVFAFTLLKRAHRLPDAEIEVYMHVQFCYSSRSPWLLFTIWLPAGAHI